MGKVAAYKKRYRQNKYDFRNRKNYHKEKHIKVPRGRRKPRVHALVTDRAVRTVILSSSFRLLSLVLPGGFTQGLARNLLNEFGNDAWDAAKKAGLVDKAWDAAKLAALGAGTYGLAAAGVIGEAAGLYTGGILANTMGDIAFK